MLNDLKKYYMLFIFHKKVGRFFNSLTNLDFKIFEIKLFDRFDLTPIYYEIVKPLKILKF